MSYIYFAVIICVITSVNGFFFKTNFKYDPAWINSIKLYFYSPIQKQIISISDETAKFPGYNSKYPLKVLIHGWAAGPDHIAISPIRNAYLARGGANFVSVNYSMAANQFYDVSRTLAPAISKKIAEMLHTWIKRMCIEPKNVHVLGHSLGAHIAGNVGKYFNGSLGRITGLDPASPQFKRGSIDGLMRSDATFVDVIHTGGGVQGDFNQRGHIDFYPNRGLPSQPGCYALDVITATSCSHYRAPLLYAESIMLPYNFISAPCDKSSLFASIKKCKPKYHVNGKGSGTVFMGEMVSRNGHGIYYLETNPSAPYGRGNYLVL